MFAMNNETNVPLHRRRVRAVRLPETIIGVSWQDQSQVLLDRPRQYYRRNENFVRRNRSATRHIHSEAAGDSLQWRKGNQPWRSRKHF
jgi:hypothetical protein